MKRPGFEGGQTPLYRRLPKRRGFNNDLFRKSYAILNLTDLSEPDLPEKMGPAEFANHGLVASEERVKILGGGEVKRPLHLIAHAFSKSARKKIEAAGGKVELAGAALENA